MARIRTVKPEFFKDYKLFRAEQDADLPLRLAYEGLWCTADREGRFEWIPEQIKIDVLPFDDVSFTRVLDALVTRGFVVKYRVDDVIFGWIPNFTKHQVVNNRERASDLPEPNENNILAREETVEQACITRGARDDDASHKEGKGREGKKKREGVLTQTVVVAKSADPTPDLPPIPESLRRGTRLSLESLPDDWRQFCEAERPDLDPERTWAIFQDHWRSKAGQAGVKLDWLATWRNWVRREGKGNGINRQADGGGGRATKDERAKAALVRGLAIKLPEPSQ